MPALINHPAVGVARLLLNRPEARNALNAQLRRALSDAFREVEGDDSKDTFVAIDATAPAPL
jgi:enoyl-CoA hydratase/carnithine racemase